MGSLSFCGGAGGFFLQSLLTILNSFEFFKIRDRVQRLYETEADLRREDDVATALSRAWCCELRKWEGKQILDHIAYRDGEICALIEVRCRNNSVNAFPTVFMSAEKMRRGLGLSDMMRVPMVFAVSWQGAIGWVDIGEQHLMRNIKFSFGGRSAHNMRDKYDRELVAEIPVSEFNLIR